jgi:hypothetical protein
VRNEKGGRAAEEGLRSKEGIAENGRDVLVHMFPADVYLQEKFPTSPTSDRRTLFFIKPSRQPPDPRPIKSSLPVRSIHNTHYNSLFNIASFIPNNIIRFFRLRDGFF